ncbi:mate-domain-containing protein [Diplogelasinospora grovesii]|uniref:Mate-domain-containing protein n=1 Tax=Diplogelasinospora grovesii TaxID=303347 RepID=A0AAN6S441_9PEZI|nr:mate-domain-containing protein [Diplogelasinospora grovesii]
MSEHGSPSRPASGSEPINIGSAGARRGSVLANFLPVESLPIPIPALPSSFLATSPIVREILERDIQDCSSGCASEDEEDEEDRPHHQANGSHITDAQLAFHPNGVAYGCGYSTVALPGMDRPVPNPREVEESLQAELELLRDNDLIPPSSSQRHRSGSVVDSLYRSVFSTRVKDHEEAVETTPLLQQDSRDGREEEAEGAPTPPPEEIVERWEEAVANQSIKTTWQREAKTLVAYSAPLIATFLLHYSVTIGSVLTVGRLGMVELAAVNLATMTASITCYVPVQGLATCLDTLCAQAYGSGHKHLVGLQAQRMTWLLWLLMVPIAVLWWFSEPILRSLVPGEETAQLAALYLRVLILGMPGVAAFESGKRFVQSQGLFHATTYTLLIGAPLSFFQNWLFVFKLNWHFAGAATAMAVTQNLLPLLLVLYVRCFEGSECWKGFSWKAFSNWGPMIKLALPGMIMIEAQFSVLEILTIAAGQFGTAQLAAQSVLVTVTSTSFNIPFPLAIATSTRVANLIGAHLSSAAQTTAKVAIAAGCLVGLFNLTILATLRRQLALVFTADKDVVEIASTAMLVCAVMQVFDSLAAVSHGLLRGVGRQAIGGYANLFSYYFVALPISLSTAFALGWKLSGLWIGVTLGLAVVSALELLYLYNADWESAVAAAEARMKSEDASNINAEPKATQNGHN